MFIVFEGIDGSGKSTQCDLLHKYLLNENIDCVRLMEPSNGEIGKKIRAILSGDHIPPVSEQVEMFIEDRKDDVEKNILPAIADGKVVLMDRYYYSNAAYQGVQGIDSKIIIDKNREMNFPEPDVVYYLDIHPDVAFDRITARSGNEKKEIFEKRELLQKIWQNFNIIADDKFVKVDATLSESEISKLIVEDFKLLTDV